MLNLSGLSFGGLASGLDTAALIQSLLAVESRPLLRLEGQRSQAQQRLDLFGQLGARLRTLQSAIQAMDTPQELSAFQVTVSDPDVVSVRVTGTPQTGSFVLDEIESLATSTLLRSIGEVGPDADVFGSGRILLIVGDDVVDIQIPAGEGSLNGIAKAIEEADFGVRASVVFDGNKSYLELAGEETGRQNSVRIVDLLSGGRRLRIRPARRAEDAVFTVNGLRIQSPDNSIEGVVEGLSFDLLAVSADPVSIKVDVDPAAIEERVQSLLDAYNEVVDFLREQSGSGVEGDAGPLSGDSTLRSLQGSLARALGGRVEADGIERFDSLAAIGVSTGKDGRLELDSAALQDALSQGFDEVLSLISTEEVGLASRLDQSLNLYTDPANGSLSVREDGLNRSLRDLAGSIERAERRLESVEQDLVLRFAALESLLGRLQAQGNALFALDT